VRCWKISADSNAAISAGCKTVNTFLRINSVISNSLLPICSATLPLRATNNKRYIVNYILINIKSTAILYFD